ncbi:mannose-1-phosphate guanylyltransferase (GDP)s [Striga asiatica]|uniref:Mannose-1-phosphate guanylyltransferase (GDP)s n=1 Tax=Striga asiatica TaxID=4170 RepID=A0A5A7P0M7_STRAF|nr:mannose-1-phosphate guanylyltransferase (GDP)s [Striga asiatica]
MGLFKRLVGLLGFDRDEEQHQHDDAAADAAGPSSSSSPGAAPLEAFASAHHLPRRGFSVPVQVPVERAPPPPLLVFCPAGDGGIQGLRWYAKRLRIDEDGDIADEFLDEVAPDTSSSMKEPDNQLPRFEVNYSTRPAKVKNLALLPNGKIQHLVEYQGRLEWV